MVKNVEKQLILTIAVEIECPEDFDVETLSLTTPYANNAGIKVNSFDINCTDEV